MRKISKSIFNQKKTNRLFNEYDEDESESNRVNLIGRKESDETNILFHVYKEHESESSRVHLIGRMESDETNRLFHV